MNRDPAVPTFTALKRRILDPTGFALVEALAAAAILAFMALGVLAGLDGASSSSGREKARSTASALAEQDQERLHGIAAVNLPGLAEEQDINVGGITYKVKSDVDWVSDTTGGTISCTSSGGKADYLRLRTVVTSTTVGKRTDSAQLESLLAPPVGSAGGNNGTLAVQVFNRDDAGQPDVTVSISGDSSGHNASTDTNSLGCAVFAMIPGDTYDIVIQETNWVDPSGTNKIEKTGTVTPGATSVTSVQYDQRAEVKTAFDSRYYDYTLGTSGQWVTKPVRAWTLSLANTKVPGGLRTFTDTAPMASDVAERLFPFANGYGIFAGKCTEQNPNSAPNVAWSAANAFQASERNTIYDRTAAPAKPVRMPTVPIMVHKGYYTAALPVSQLGKPAPFGRANVVAKLITADAALCSDTIPSVATNSSWGLTSYPTVTTGGRTLVGTAAKNFSDGMAGFVTKVPGTTGGAEFDPSLPFGTWQICADDNNGSSSRRNFIKVTNSDPDGGTAVQYINLGNLVGQSGPLAAGEANKRCSDGGWPAP